MRSVTLLGLGRPHLDGLRLARNDVLGVAPACLASRAGPFPLPAIETRALVTVHAPVAPVLGGCRSRKLSSRAPFLEPRFGGFFRFRTSLNLLK
jgi:hypothetical protein